MPIDDLTALGQKMREKSILPKIRCRSITLNGLPLQSIHIPN